MAAGHEILVVDDDVDVRTALQRVLERRGYVIRTAADAAEAIAEYRRRGADLVITDVIMPGEDGISLIRRLRAEHPGVRILAVSGGGKVSAYQPTAISTAAFLKSAELAGADVLLTKPFERQELFDAIDRLLGAH
jgi:CheY-like chemotaxis protein